ncbi:unnamed protein product [Ranitomeya imitator]|uniref:Protein kinase domain-containing protein n=1 Tax=Ranitomeya imitator TaxID=111125 RepID=A0ABN9KXH8_9NEOB|nr:unnamed protein product [Ranitomeya imitator]
MRCGAAVGRRSSVVLCCPGYMPGHMTGACDRMTRTLSAVPSVTPQHGADAPLHRMLISHCTILCFQAHHKERQEWAAVKILEISCEEALEDHVSEINILGQCQHLNILRLLEAIFWDRQLWIIVEFCAGGALDGVMHDCYLCRTHPRQSVVLNCSSQKSLLPETMVTVVNSVAEFTPVVTSGTAASELPPSGVLSFMHDIFREYLDKFLIVYLDDILIFSDDWESHVKQVEVDASEIGAGAVLSQRGSDCSVMKPCAFFSRKFSPAERNYDVGNRELLAMKWAFEEWRHWLEGAKHRVVVLTDHKNLTYLESAKRLNPRQARWSLFFARFDFVISYLPGSKNVKADALSRSFVPDSPGLSEPAGILKEGVIVSAISPDLRRVLQKFQANKPDRCPAEKLFVPDRWTNKLISELHCSVLAGHPGIFELGHGLTEGQIQVVSYQTLLGLQHLHSNKIIHRDLKAGNILLTQHGDIRLGKSCSVSPRKAPK